jgi:alginate O-acetyltransferase complex protein AlgI
VERFLTERLSGSRLSTAGVSRVGLALLTYVLVLVTWVFFRARDFPSAWRLLGSMFGVAGEGKKVLYWIGIIEVAAVTAVMLAAHWRMRDTTLEAVVERTPAWAIAVLLTLMAFAVITTQGSGNAFIYFQF